MPKFDPSSILSDDEKADIVNQRAKQWAKAAFGHQLNRESRLDADPDADTEDIDAELEVLTKKVKGAVNKAERLEAARLEAENVEA